ncbi:MAG TPA: IS1634 family transposase [Haliangium sp.]|nr:IS1634 family transposase [Haliangium sp.]
MFFRTVKAPCGAGEEREYVRLVESYWEDGKTKQRIVCNLGRKDVLAAHLDGLVRLIEGKDPSGAKARIHAGNVEAAGAWDWGPVLVARALWHELGLDAILERLLGRNRRDGTAWAERAFVLCANRLCQPSSEHGLARWLELDFVCDSAGRRWLPEWREERERTTSKSPRVRVEFRQLKRWYRTLDQLFEHKAEIEKELFLRLRELFALSVDFVLYDLTSTYFEGRGPAMAEHGYSRDGKPRDRQVLVGVVMVDGWPITHHVFRGKLRDSQTVATVLDDLQQRFGLRRVVFVGDRGMVTIENLKLLRASEQGYIVGLTRRRREEVYRYVERATGPWLECPVGIAASEAKSPPSTKVQEVPSDQPGVRVFVVHSDERLAYERSQRLKSMERVRTQLQALQKRVESGHLKAPEKIGAAAARILARSHGQRYFDWSYEDGRFRFFEHPVQFEREQAFEGKYVIQTEEAHLTPVEAVCLYKDLSEVERAFANLKDVIEMRPIHHQTDDRVKAHIQVAALAFLLHRALEKKLKAARLDISATAAWQALRSVRLVEIDLGDGSTKRSVTRGTGHAAAILKALGIAELHPPTPSKETPLIT